MCARDEVRQLGDGKHKDEIEKRLNSRDTHLLLGLCCLHLHPVSLLKALLNRVECCLYILCYTRTFWQANGATVLPQRRQASSSGVWFVISLLPSRFLLGLLKLNFSRLRAQPPGQCFILLT